MSVSAAVSDAPAPRGVRHGARALAGRNFRLFFAGALVSNLGSWMQNATVPYVLYELTGSATWVGVAAFCALFPGVLLGPISGSLADRFPRRTVLLVIMVASAALAFLLWAMWVAGVRSPVAIVAVVAGGGALMGLSMPSWQGFVHELVPREHFLSAISLNSAQFNASRAIGPAIAGVVLAAWGPSWAFLVNGISYGAVLLALAAIRTPALPRLVPTKGVIGQLREAVTHVRERRGLLVSVGLVAAIGVLGFPAPQLSTVFANETYGVGAGAYGVLTGAFGLGAMSSALALAASSGHLLRSRLASRSTMLLAIALVLLGTTAWYPVGVLAMFLIGCAVMGISNSTMTSIQLIVDESFRGRVLAVYAMAFTGTLPVGAVLQGALSDTWGPRPTVLLAGLLTAALVVVLRARRALDALDRADG